MAGERERRKWLIRVGGLLRAPKFAVKTLPAHATYKTKVEWALKSYEYNYRLVSEKCRLLLLAVAPDASDADPAEAGSVLPPPPHRHPAPRLLLQVSLSAAAAAAAAITSGSAKRYVL